MRLIPSINREVGFTPLEIDDSLSMSDGNAPTKIFKDRRFLSLTGFTLIELLMTIVVVGIIAIPLSLLISQHIQSIFISEDFTLAGQLVRFEMEKVNNLAYANINSTSFSNYEGYNFDVVRTVSYAYGDPTSVESLKRIIVDVKKSGAATILVSLVTFIAKNVGYGLG